MIWYYHLRNILGVIILVPVVLKFDIDIPMLRSKYSV